MTKPPAKETNLRPRPQAPSVSGAMTTAPTLRSTVVEVFKRVGGTMSAGELAKHIRKTAYRSKTKDLKNLLWVSLGKIPEVERDPLGGYRLKKAKA